MNRDWWASPTEAYIYNEFADALREGFRLGCSDEDDLLADDAHVLARLQGGGEPAHRREAQAILHFHADGIAGYVPRVVPKNRWLDPPVRIGTTSAGSRNCRAEISCILTAPGGRRTLEPVEGGAVDPGPDDVGIDAEEVTLRHVALARSV